MPPQTTRDQIKPDSYASSVLQVAWGKLIGNETLRARGEQDRRLGRMWRAYSVGGALTMRRRATHSLTRTRGPISPHGKFNPDPTDAGCVKRRVRAGSVKFPLEPKARPIVRHPRQFEVSCSPDR
jgi:hypothetical protein